MVFLLASAPSLFSMAAILLCTYVNTAVTCRSRCRWPRRSEQLGRKARIQASSCSSRCCPIRSRCLAMPRYWWQEGVGSSPLLERKRGEQRGSCCSFCGFNSWKSGANTLYCPVVLTLTLTKVIYIKTHRSILIAGIDLFLHRTCTQGHVSAPRPILSAHPHGGAIFFHSVARLTLEGDILIYGEVFPIAKAIGRQTWIPTVYHWRNWIK